MLFPKEKKLRSGMYLVVRKMLYKGEEVYDVRLYTSASKVQTKIGFRLNAEDITWLIEALKETLKE